MANAAALRERLTQREQAVAAEALRLLFNELLVAVPVGDTGETRRGLTVTPGGNGTTTFGGTVQSSSPHGDWVEEGRSYPLDIDLSGTGRVMRFQAGSRRISQGAPTGRIATRGGGVVFTTKIHQEPRPPYPWFRPVVDRWLEFLERAQATVA